MDTRGQILALQKHQAEQEERRKRLAAQHEKARKELEDKQKRQQEELKLKQDKKRNRLDADLAKDDKVWKVKEDKKREREEKRQLQKGQPEKVSTNDAQPSSGNEATEAQPLLGNQATPTPEETVQRAQEQVDKIRPLVTTIEASAAQFHQTQTPSPSSSWRSWLCLPCCRPKVDQSYAPINGDDPAAKQAPAAPSMK